MFVIKKTLFFSLVSFLFIIKFSHCYLVHEVIEDDEISRGKRQENGVVISGLFNIPVISAFDSALVKKARQQEDEQLQQQQELNNRRQDDNINVLLYNERNPKYYYDSHKRRQKLYRDYLQKKKFQQMQTYHKQMQEKKYNDQLNLNSLTRLIIGPFGLFSGRKSIFAFPTTTKQGINTYNVFERVDEGNNPFTWPKWFGIGNLFSFNQPTSNYDDKIENKIAPKIDQEYNEKKLTKPAKLYKEIYVIARNKKIDDDSNNIEETTTATSTTIEKIVTLKNESKLVLPN